MARMPRAAATANALIGQGEEGNLFPRDPRGLLPAGSLDPSRSLVEGPRLARGPRTGAAERAPFTVASLGPDRRVTTVTASSRTPNAKLPPLY